MSSKSIQGWIWLISCLVVTSVFIVGCSTKPVREPQVVVEGHKSVPPLPPPEQQAPVASPVVVVSPLDNPTNLLHERLLYFAFDKSLVTSRFYGLLNAHAAYLIAHQDAKVRLEGHCDERGTREYNIGLGERRASSVKGYLTAIGVPGDQIDTFSYGEEMPADPGRNWEAWRKNRRVEIVYLNR